MKTRERERARELRALGWSVKEIELSLGVARSSVSRWVRTVELGDAQLKALAACNLFADHEERQRELEDFWLDRLGLDRTSLRRSTINRHSRASQRKRLNVLPYGTCSVIVGDTRLVQTIYGSIQEYGGFDRPAWLD